MIEVTVLANTSAWNAYFFQGWYGVLWDDGVRIVELHQALVGGDIWTVTATLGTEYVGEAYDQAKIQLRLTNQQQETTTVRYRIIARWFTVTGHPVEPPL